MATIETETTGLVIERCAGCGVVLPAVDGPTHRYIGASRSCWRAYTTFTATGGGRSPLAAALVDAYAAQHPGEDSKQAVQSVAVHLVTLHSILTSGTRDSLAVRVAAVEAGRRGSAVYRRLVPAPATWPWTIDDVITDRVGVDDYVASVYRQWMKEWADQVVAWHASCRL